MLLTSQLRLRRTIPRGDVAEVCQPSVWDVGNSILYKLCRQYPAHDSIDVIIAKVWLIGRSYAAAIERGKADSLPSDSFYPKRVGPVLKASGIDTDLRRIDPHRELRNEVDAAIALEVHARLTATFRRASS